MIIDQIQDIALQYVPIFKENDPQRQVLNLTSFLITFKLPFFKLKFIKDAMNQQFFKSELPALLGYLENLLKSNKQDEHFFLGKTVINRCIIMLHVYIVNNLNILNALGFMG